MKLKKINCNAKTYSMDNDSNLMKVKLMIVHPGVNRNNSNISTEAIDDAAESVKNIPILGYVKKDEDGNIDDFDSHNMETKIVNTDEGFKLETTYHEIPIGLIPESCDYRYEEVNGIDYFTVDGYIWKSYSNSAYKLIENSEFKNVSMEIKVTDGCYDSDEGYYSINKFEYQGVTVLGDSVQPGIEGANIVTYSSSKKYKKYLEDLYNEIYTLNNGKEEDVMENENQIEESIVEETPEGEVVIPDTVEPEVNEVETPETFALSIDNINISINSVLKDRKVETENYWGEKYSTREFYLYTILPEEKIAVVEDNVNYYNYYGIPYEIKGDDVVLNFDAKVPYIQEWRAKKEDEVIEVFTKEDELKSIVLEKFEKKEQELENLKSEMVKLEEFKATKDKEELSNKVNDIVEEFSTLEETEIEVVKTKALNNEIGLDEFKKELFCLVGMKALNNKETFAANEVVEEVAIMDNHIKSEVTDAYGGLISKYKK